MKKILILAVIILTVFLIYLTTIDKKIYYLALGDEISLGMTENGYYEKDYTKYVKEYLEKINKLEIYQDEFRAQGYRITDIINDIENNKEIEETNKTIKNALIKSDLVTISIGTNDIISKTNAINKYNYNNIKESLEKINKDMESLLKLIREYCKEDIILIGIYINDEDENINNLLKNENIILKNLSEKYNITYVDLYNTLNSKEKFYPNKEDYTIIGNKIIEIINNKILTDNYHI